MDLAKYKGDIRHLHVVFIKIFIKIFKKRKIFFSRFLDIKNRKEDNLKKNIKFSLILLIKIERYNFFNYCKIFY